MPIWTNDIHGSCSPFDSFSYAVDVTCIPTRGSKEWMHSRLELPPLTTNGFSASNDRWMNHGWELYFYTDIRLGVQHREEQGKWWGVR